MRAFYRVSFRGASPWEEIKMKRPKRARVLMATVLLSLIGANIQAVGQPNVEGKWEFLAYDSAEAQWRNNTTRLDGDTISPYVNFSWTNQDWKIVYGVHSILTYGSSGARVLTYGLGKAAPRSAQGRTGIPFNYIQYTPYLFWNPADLSGRGAFGYIGYLEDPDESYDPEWHTAWNGNLFCGAHSFLPDGRSPRAASGSSIRIPILTTVTPRSMG